MKRLLLLNLLFLCSVFSFSQKLLTGNVKDEQGQAVVGASVVIKNSNLATITNLDGNFSMTSNEEEGDLSISLLGMKTIEVHFLLPQHFDLVMQENTVDIEDVVVIGYGTSKKSGLTNSVASAVNVEQISERPVTNAPNFLQGNIAGVTVTNQGGDPTAAPKVSIRGLGSLNNESVLWVVDGMPYEGGTINPEDIKSINVLKDASAAAIYGAKAGSGVIVVTTKDGVAGKPRIEFNTYAGISQAMNLPTPLTSTENNWVYNTAADNSGVSRNEARNETFNPWGAVTRTNWVDAIFRNASILNSNLRISGGGKKAKYSTSLNYMNKDGVLLGTGLERIAARVKSQFNITDKIKVGENIYFTHEEAIGTNTSSGYSGTIINAIYMPSASPIYDKNGKFFGVAPQGSVYAGAYGDVYNPVALLLRPSINAPGTDINANIYTEISPLSNLTFRSSYSWIGGSYKYKRFDPKRPENGRPSEMNYLQLSNSNYNNWIWENQLSYKKYFNEHQIDLTAVYTASKSRYTYNKVRAQNFASEESFYQYLGNAKEIIDHESVAWEEAYVSMVGRLRYNFRETYFLTASVRQDVTSRLAQDNNSGIFPAFSVAWNIANEEFMKSLEWLNTLKIRASWGTIGNINSANYYAFNVPMSSQRPTMGAGNAVQVPGYYVKKQSNPNLKWESSESLDFGLDVSLWNGKLDITADYFTKITKDMIMTLDANKLIGVDQGADMNVGEVENKGFEIAVTHKGNISENMRHSISANVAVIKNNLKSLKNYTSDFVYHGNSVRSALYPFRSEPGQPLFSYHLISCEGTFKNQAEIDAHKHNGELIQPNAKPGDLKFTDTNGDGKINDDDRTFKGSAFPDFTYGFNYSLGYKNFDLSVTLQGVWGNKVFNGAKFTTYNASQQGYNLDNRVLDAWSSNNTNSDIPILRVDDPNSNFGTNSDWYLENGSYLRVKNISLSYNLPTSFMSKIVKNSSLKLYLSAENVFTITGYSGIDPEVSNHGMDVGVYPIARTFIGGISLSF